MGLVAARDLWLAICHSIGGYALSVRRCLDAGPTVSLSSTCVVPVYRDVGLYRALLDRGDRRVAAVHCLVDEPLRRTGRDRAGR